jgi:hypothetical protein
MKTTFLFVAVMASLLTESVVLAQDTTLTITNTGNVGIGTVTPLAKLHVAGQGGNTVLLEGSQPYLILNTNFTFQSGIEFWANGGRKWAIFTDAGGYSSNNLSFRATDVGATRLFIDSSGNVGIGTTLPDQSLSVNGGASKVGGGSWATFSDRRLKKDINNFTDGLSVLKAIRPVTFRYNGKLGYPTDKTYVGVIAQEIQPVAPYTVDSYRAKLSPGDTKETDLLRFDGTALTYIAINAIKEMDKKIEQMQELQKQNRNLSERLTELEAIVKSLAADKNNVNHTSMTGLR